MECQDIREHLSGYIDNALDQGERDIVEKHIADCSACREELDSLKALVKEISSVKPVKPPEDFLFQIHRRMDPGFSLASIARKLFAPLRVKIPMHFAATVAVCVLVIFIVNTLEVKKEMPDFSRKTPGRGTAEYVVKDALDEETVVPSKAEPALEKPEDKKVPVSLSPYAKPIEIELVLDRGASHPSDVTGKDSRAPLSLKKSMPVHEKENRQKEKGIGYFLKQETKPADIARPTMKAEVIEEDRLVQDYSEETTEEAEEEPAVDTFKNEELRKPGKEEIATAKIIAAHPEKKPKEPQVKLHTLVESVQGKVVKISYDNNNRPTALLADIPADNYTLFCGKLNEIGRFVSPPPTADLDGNRIRVLVRFTMN
jgi:hypothetical protein